MSNSHTRPIRPTSRLRTIQDALSPAEWRRIGGMAAFVVLLWVAGWVMLLAASGKHYYLGKGSGFFGVGTGILALTFGMRHAFDADHIAAIDNTTRKLMAERKRPLSVGFWFSLGHSSIVFLLSVALNFGVKEIATQVKQNNSSLHRITNIVGTSVSGVFLYLIAALNLVILVSIVRVFRDMRKGLYDEAQLEAELDKRGLMNRFLGGLAKRIDKGWKMYPLGMLFGLGFDTATEVALLVISSTAVASGLPFYAILSLPLLFAAGMSLFDTLDGCFMNFAYGWAFSRPIRKVYYNLVITALSIGVAFLIGTIELISLLTQELNVDGGTAQFFQNFNINTAGYVVVGLFVVTWAVALAVWKYGHIETRWDAAADIARAERGELALAPVPVTAGQSRTTDHR
jgi:high-affinity nickel-transport protein